MSKRSSNASLTSTVRQFFRYGLAAATALFVHLSVLVILVSQLGVQETTATALGFICAVPVNFHLQRRYVFGSTADLSRSFAMYCGITLATLILNTAIFWVIYNWSGVHYTVAQIATTLAIALINFFANRTFTFSKRDT